MTTHLPPTIIAFASPKGGVGKSTTCLSLAGALAAAGHEVTIIDFDQTETLWRWYSTNDNARQIPGLRVEQGPTGNLAAFVEEVWNNRRGYVLIDLAGKLTDQTLHLAVFASLTITPAKISEPDILEASKLSQQLSDVARRIGKPIAHRIVLNEVPSLALLPNYQSYILNQLPQMGMACFNTYLHQRAAYAEAFMTGLPAHFADRKRPAVAKAVEEVDRFLVEVYQLLQTQEERAAA